MKHLHILLSIISCGSWFLVSGMPRMDSNCPKKCNNMYGPICVTFANGFHKRFDYQCSLKDYQCKNEELDIVKEEVCEWSDVNVDACEKSECPVADDPVCVTFASGIKILFDSLCRLEDFFCRHPELYDDTKSKTGLCEIEGRSSSCDSPCPAEVKPLCVTFEDGNSRQYSQPCEFDRFICKHPDLIHIDIKEGACT